MERAHRHKGYDIALTSMKESAGWVPAATVKSAPMQPHRDEWTIRETSLPQPSQDAADRIALERAMKSIDDQANRPKTDPRKQQQYGGQPKPQQQPYGGQPKPQQYGGQPKQQYGGQPKGGDSNQMGRKKAV
jgi:hypothetical protein